VPLILLVFFLVVALFISQAAGCLGGICGLAAGLLSRARLGPWVRRGVSGGFVAGIPLSFLVVWWYFLTLPNAGRSPTGTLLAWLAACLSVAGPLAAALAGAWVGRRSGNWPRGLVVGVLAGSAAGGAAGVALYTTSMGLDLQRLAHVATSLTFSKDGKQIVSVTLAGKVAAWDPATGRQVWEADGHADDRVVMTILSDDGRLVAACGNNGAVRLWDAQTGQAAFSWRGDPELLRAAFREDGRRLTAVSRLGAVRVWDTRTGEEVRARTIQPGLVFSAAFSPDGRRLATFGPEGLRVTSGFAD
jgi:hypothetical protein